MMETRNSFSFGCSAFFQLKSEFVNAQRLFVSFAEHRIETKDDDTLLIDFSPFDPENPGKVRQTLKFVDRDHHTWKAELKTDAGWQTLIDATWVRKKG